MEKIGRSLWSHTTLSGKVLRSSSQITIKVVKRELLSSSLDGHTLISRKSASSLVRPDTWLSKFSHHRNLSPLMLGHNKVSSTHGGSFINQLPTSFTAEWEQEMSSEI